MTTTLDKMFKERYKSHILELLFVLTYLNLNLNQT